jgi:hypothetical protein
MAYANAILYNIKESKIYIKECLRLKKDFLQGYLLLILIYSAEQDYKVCKKLLKDLAN